MSEQQSEQQEVIKGYRLVRPLGKGGMGTVFVVEKLSTHELYAMKFLVDELAEEEQYGARFAREIEALRSIRHPHVVDIFDWSLGSRPGEKSFIVMELLEGEGLDALLRREKTLSPSLAMRIMLQVLDALGTAHRVAVLHRDIGPSNIILLRKRSLPGRPPQFHVKLLDFGLAKSTAGGDASFDVTQAGSLMGKPPYVPPEVFRGQRTDERSDIFACGILLYRMVTGRLPYRETQGQLLWVERFNTKDDAVEYPPPREFAPQISPALDAIIARAVRKSADDRYQTAEEMQVDLLAIEQDDEAGVGSLSRPPLPLPVPRETAGGDSARTAS
ncbi:MAG: serine/threonine-protein kinase, partial [Myxococcota bacterium]|nr:serine/threonine-protein kinase [Myxococcota bacterium]